MAAGSSFSRWGCCRLLSARYTLSREVTALVVASGWGHQDGGITMRASDWWHDYVELGLPCKNVSGGLGQVDGGHVKLPGRDNVTIWLQRGTGDTLVCGCHYQVSGAGLWLGKWSDWS